MDSCTIKLLRRFTLSNPKSGNFTRSVTEELEPMADVHAKYEWIIFIALSTAFLCSLMLPALNSRLICGLKLWRWILIILSTIGGRLVSSWAIKAAVLVNEQKVMYFVYGLRRRTLYYVWLGFVLLMWAIVFDAKLRQRNKVLDKVFQALVASLIGFTIWLIKIVAIKALASSFYINTYFERMKESAFNHYVLETLTNGDVVSNEPSRKKKIDIQELKKLSMLTEASAWTIKKLTNYVKSFGLTTAMAVGNFDITSQREARNCAKSIFNNVAKADAKYIEEEDLASFLNRSEIQTMIPLFQGAVETGKITKSAFKNWLVRVYYERKCLTHSLNDTKRVVRELHKLVNAVVIIIILVESLSVMNLISDKVMVFLLTQLLLLGFTFWNMCKTLFESIVFVFLKHPFDIGDRCVIDGVEMIVEEMNMLSTVFLKLDNEKLYYPNSELIRKPISNFYRSSEMRDVIDFDINSSTSKETIEALRKSIQAYILSKPKQWNPTHSVIVKGIENVHVMKMALCVQHTINHQYNKDRCTRITGLILELKAMFQDLNIKDHLQQVHVSVIN